ncbi:MAG: hypothetical protein ACYSUD_00930 [Planctomycetota bacterium]
MRQLSLRISVSVLSMFFVGCADRCFYQAGKSIEQCQDDLLECAYSDSDVDVCMQAKGYKYSDAIKLAQNGKQKKVTVRFEEHAVSGDRRVISKTYRVMDGLGAVPRPRRVLSEQRVQISNSNAPARKLIGYKARKDDSDKYIFIPVYENQQEQ